MNNHVDEVVRAGLSLFFLATVFTLEAISVYLTGSLTIASQLVDVVGDTAAVFIVLSVSTISWWKDKVGRDHVQNHPESSVAAVVNLFILLIGVIAITSRSIFEFTSPREPVDEWLLLVVPVIAGAIYWGVNRLLSKSKEPTLAIESLRIHVKADVRSSIVVFFATFLTLAIRTSWINPLGGLIVAAILLLVSRELGQKILEV